MVPGADRDPAFVKDRTDIVRVHPRHREADDSGAVVRPEQGDAVPPRQRLAQRSDQHAFMRMDRLDADARDIIDRRREAQRLADRSEEHTSELQSLMRNSYAAFCW